MQQNNKLLWAYSTKFAAANINMVAVKQVLAFKESISYDGEHSLYKKIYKSVWLWVIISIAQPKKKSILFFNMFKWCCF